MNVENSGPLKTKDLLWAMVDISKAHIFIAWVIIVSIFLYFIIASYRKGFKESFREFDEKILEKCRRELDKNSSQETFIAFVRSNFGAEANAKDFMDFKKII